MCFVWFSEQTINLPYTSLTDCVLHPKWRVLIARYGLSPYITRIHLVFERLIHVPCICIILYYDQQMQNIFANCAFVGHSTKLLFIFFIFSGSAAQRGLWPPRPRGFLFTHNDVPQSVGLLWTSDQLVAETST
jgi:hypothetical protein